MLQTRMLATIVTRETIFKGHVFEIETFADEQTEVVIRNRRDQVVRRLSGAAVESRDGTVWRVVGRNAASEEEVWRAVRGCARCSTEGSYPTPAWEVPE